MRPRLPVLLIAVFAITCLSARADEWRKEFTTSGKLNLRVETNDADIRISAWDRKETEARITSQGYKLNSNDVRITDHQNGDQVELEVHRPSGIHFSVGWHDRYIRIEINVPRDADLNLHSGDGNIRVNGVKGQFHLESGDGDIEVRAADGKLTSTTQDGNIRVEGRFDGLDLHTGDGNIDAAVAKGSVMSSGWTLRSSDGNVVMRVPEGFSADLDANTGDGHVTVGFPVTVVGSIRESNIRGKLNGGGATLELRTGDGNIELEKM